MKKSLRFGGSFLDLAYKFFIENKADTITDGIDKKIFKSIIKDIYIEIKKYMLSGKEVSIPCGMGDLMINKKMSDKRRMINYKESEQFGRFMPENNYHTDGYRFAIQWRKDRPIFGSQRGYCFKANRALARELASILKSGGGYIYQSRNYNKIEKYEI